MGAYDELAHYHGGQGKRASSFSVGFSEANMYSARRESNRRPTSIVGTFSSSSGQPILSQIKVENRPWCVEAQLKDEHIELQISTPSGKFNIQDISDVLFPALSVRAISYMLDILLFTRPDTRRHELFEGLSPSREELESLYRMLGGFGGLRPQRGQAIRPIAIAPIRSRPKRTYDPLSEVRSPEGEHVPMLLARLSAADPSKWSALAESLSAYGRASGLFDQVIVRRFAGSESAPFQLRVRLAGQRKEVNLVDVGYGVSQILPILVDSLIEERSAFFLMQQPEVHLHPRAQAELGTFLSVLVRERSHRFLIETHSDHLVDRIRLEVKNKLLRPEAVSILFLERSGVQVYIHALGLDPAGNLIGQPGSYRRFFLEEELRIISS
ncbi:MAG TPA: AAA family ATPase [Thermoanaerobaculia bacterium]